MSIGRIHWIALGVIFSFVGLRALAADNAKPEPKPDQPQTIKLTLHPANPPAAALHYPLLPKYLDQTPGNAVPLYLKAVSLIAEDHDSGKLFDQVGTWVNMPPAELPKEKVRAALRTFILEELRMAARRERCEWDPPIRETANPFAILLPEQQHLRNIGRLLALQARLDIAEGKTTEAVDTLSSGYAMARHTAACPFLVSGLIGIAISTAMDDQVLALIQTPDCPNLYWSLTALPDPLIDLRPAAEVEQATLVLELPELRDIEHAQRSADEWNAQLASLMRRLTELNNLVGGKWVSGTEAATEIVAAAQLAVALPKAKAGLLAAGRDKQEVEAMPPAQAILVYMAITQERLSDEMFKWFNVPFAQSRDDLATVERKFETEYRQQEIVPLTSMLVPAILSVKKATARSQRRIAALRVLEALRLYAADHDGKLPVALDDIREVPLPLDPVSDKPFGYERTADNRAVLEGPPPTGMLWADLGLRYEIEMAAAKKK